MGDDIQVTQIACSSKKALWTREMERKFLDLLHEQVQLGRKGEGTFKKEAWTAIGRRFNGELNLNLSKDNFKNKLKTWKQGYKIMEELKNTSGFEWNETTQSMNADEKVWNEFLKRKELKNAKVFKRQPFKYYNDLAFIVGNDMAESNTAATAQKTEEGNPIDEDIGTPLETAADLDDEDITVPISNQSRVSGKQFRSTSSSRRPKRKRASAASLMDVICETINKLHEGLSKPQIIKVDQSDLEKDLDDVYDVLKAIPELSLTTMLVAYDSFLVEPARAMWFLIMTQEEKIEYIQMKFGGTSSIMKRT